MGDEQKTSQANTSENQPMSSQGAGGNQEISSTKGNLERGVGVERKEAGVENIPSLLAELLEAEFVLEQDMLRVERDSKKKTINDRKLEAKLQTVDQQIIIKNIKKQLILLGYEIR